MKYTKRLNLLLKLQSIFSIFKCTIVLYFFNFVFSRLLNKITKFLSFSFFMNCYRLSKTFVHHIYYIISSNNDLCLLTILIIYSKPSHVSLC